MIDQLPPEPPKRADLRLLDDLDESWRRGDVRPGRPTPAEAVDLLLRVHVTASPKTRWAIEHGAALLASRAL